MSGMSVSPDNPMVVGVDTVRGWEPLRFHLFTRSPHSGAGNCVCGGSYEHVRHPHEPVPVLTSDFSTTYTAPVCVCSRPVSEHMDNGEVAS